MKRRHVVVAVAIIALLVIAASAYYYTAWRTARAGVVAAVLGDEIAALGPADPTWRQQLGAPTREDLVVTTTHGDWLALSTELAFDFVLTNEGAPAVAPLNLGASVQLAPSGWEVLGYGSGG